MSAEPGTSLIPQDGPYLAFAVLCQYALQEKDGTLSIVRIVDRFTLTAELVSETGEVLPAEEIPPVRFSTTLALGFKSGKARGTYPLDISIESPVGEIHRLSEQEIVPVLLQGEDQGQNVIVNIGMDVRREGLYWITVGLGGQVLTRVPLRIAHDTPSSGLVPS